MIDHIDRTANLVGALALSIVDRMQRAVFDGAALHGETVAALIAIGHSPGMTIGQLGTVLARSHPGTVRIVDRLAAARLVERRTSSSDRRSVTLFLTPEGLTDRTAVLARRQSALREIVQLVESDDLLALEQVSETILRALPDDAASALAICRYCDERRCRQCPMEPFGLPS